MSDYRNRERSLYHPYRRPATKNPPISEAQALADPGSTYARQFQRISYADCYWRLNNASDPWKAIPEAYSPENAATMTILGNVCGVYIEGDGIVICQQLEEYEKAFRNPRRRVEVSEDRVRIGVRFSVSANHNFVFRERLDPKLIGRTLIEISWESSRRPQVFNASWVCTDPAPADPVATKMVLGDTANELPLAAWAKSIPYGTRYEMQLVFRRSRATAQATRWDWMSACALLSGWPMMQTHFAKVIYDHHLAKSVYQLAEVEEYRPYLRPSRSGEAICLNKWSSQSSLQAVSGSQQQASQPPFHPVPRNRDGPLADIELQEEERLREELKRLEQEEDDLVRRKVLIDQLAIRSWREGPVRE
ncbi:MAG: hypothetical protein Q9166_002527 [cf. Caloplaca sp. 2 TL-2023]